MTSLSNVGLFDLPNEILLIIFKQLNNMDVLYSLFGIGNQRFNIFLQEYLGQTLNFAHKTMIDGVVQIDESIFHRFCIEILPKMNHCVRSLIVESDSMGRVLLAGDYPNLTQLQIYNFTEPVIFSYFTSH